MGDYFLMSHMFNKKTPEDFGLVHSLDPEVLIRPSDNSQWKQRDLYDFGWGQENGYYKLPMPGFDGLVEIILHADNDEDRYGAAAVILDDHCDELLDKCLQIFSEDGDASRYAGFFRTLDLQVPLNRSPILGKHYAQIEEDYNKWKTIAEKVKGLEPPARKKGVFSRLWLRKG